MAAGFCPKGRSDGDIAELSRRRQPLAGRITTIDLMNPNRRGDSRGGCPVKYVWIVLAIVLPGMALAFPGMAVAEGPQTLGQKCTSDAASSYRGEGRRKTYVYDIDNKCDFRICCDGNAYLAKGEPDRAIADYNEAIRIDPEYVLAFNNRGNVYRGKGDVGAPSRISTRRSGSIRKNSSLITTAVWPACFQGRCRRLALTSNRCARSTRTTHSGRCGSTSSTGAASGQAGWPRLCLRST